MIARARARLHHAQYVLRQQGIAALVRLVGKRIKRKMGRYAPGMYDFGYEQWLLKQQSNKVSHPHELTPVISILVPVYNVAEAWLTEMVESVIAQSYPHWELCLVNDCATALHVAPALERLARLDQRIKLTHNSTNKGIAATSNQALGLASGEYVALLDHDDLLSADALDCVIEAINLNPQAELFYSDEDKIDSSGRQRSPFFKPDYSPALLLGQNYFGHLVVLTRNLMDRISGFRPGFDGAQDYDLILRATAHTAGIVHIPKVLYHWREIPGSTAMQFGEKDYAWEAGRTALQSHLDRRGGKATAEKGEVPGTYRVQYGITGNPLVTVIIPFRDQPELLDQCLESLLSNTGWQQLEILGIDNQSQERATFEIKKKWSEVDSRVRFMDYDQAFNFSAICNSAVRQASGDYVVLLNNDVEIQSDAWLETMLQHAQQKNTGAVGAQLLYPDNTIQHAGIVLGIGGTAGHAFKRFASNDIGYFGRLKITSNVSAVSAALLMVDKKKYLEVGGLDESAFSVALNDVDFCLKLLDQGYENIVTSDVSAIHHESVSRGSDRTHANAERLAIETAAFQTKWAQRLAAGDPFYNPNLTLESEDYRLRGL